MQRLDGVMVEYEDGYIIPSVDTPGLLATYNDNGLDTNNTEMIVAFYCPNNQLPLHITPITKTVPTTQNEYLFQFGDLLAKTATCTASATKIYLATVN